jgi:hypothetical protein
MAVLRSALFMGWLVVTVMPWALAVVAASIFLRAWTTCRRRIASRR